MAPATTPPLPPPDAFGDDILKRLAEREADGRADDVAILIFSAFILVDLQRVVNGGETNYVTATLGVYLSVYNVFSNLLAILGIFGGDRD